MDFVENISRKKRLIVWLCLVILFLGTLYLKIYPLSLKTVPVFGKITKDIDNELFTALLTLITFGLIYQVYTEKENREIAKKDVIDAIQADGKTLALFSKEAKMGFVKNIICTLIGNKYGELLYSNMIEKYLEGNIAYRENFNYAVELNEAHKDFTFKGIKVLSKDRYYSLDQTIVYTKHFKKDIKDIDFKIVFAFDTKSLDHWMNEESVFFREELSIEDWENDISSYTADDFKEFVEKCLNLKFRFLNDNDSSDTKSTTNFNVNYINTDGAKGIEIILKNKQVLRDAWKTDKTTIFYRCELSFSMPFNKKTTRFHFALPEPTLNPTFNIRFDRNFKNINYFTHFSNTEKQEKVKVDPNGLKYSISTFEIIYPRSGIIFFWDA